MLRYIVKRLLQLIPTLFGLSVLLFAWVRALPGGPENALLPDNATAADREAAREALGLNEPIWLQYGLFMQRLLQFDLGTTLQGRQVSTEIAERFPATFELAMMAMIIAFFVGVPLGYLAARKRGGILDFGAVAGSLVGICTPVFFLAFMLKEVFAVQLGWLPAGSRLTTGLSYTNITGLRVFDSIITGEFHVTGDALTHLILPGLALSSIPLAVITRMTRASVLETLGEDFVRTAESKGLKAHVIQTRHVLRNAMLPVVTATGLLTGALLAGAVLTESVFNFGGLGSFVYNATQTRDYEAIMGSILLIAVVFVIVNLLVDLCYTLLDPRVRVQ
ncbi:ABC transporter permease [Natronoglycomyces albus]|uniref:ABC transporter permease n=1 Tax=Natronoglycomyces albus TaxID=2811108 RepID=A0A895XMF0_9ACTN|nr:ABC transporter permease [Natronoglycomyces albus]QSB04713.1 ABC transporter permease [Natronoglycomyces albus]